MRSSGLDSTTKTNKRNVKDASSGYSTITLVIANINYGTDLCQQHMIGHLCPLFEELALYKGRFQGATIATKVAHNT